MSTDLKTKADSLKSLVVDPLNAENPVTVHVLGICSALAVTSQVKPAFVMGIGLTLVAAFGNLLVSSIRKTIPGSIRMIIQLLVVAALVQLVSDLLKAFVFDIYAELSVFIGLILTNCIVMGRLEAYAMAKPPVPSFFDGLGYGLGYTVILVLMGTIREILGKGTWFGLRVMPEGYVLNNLMLLPCASLFIIGIVIWVQKTLKPSLLTKD